MSVTINKFDGEFAFLSNFYPSEIEYEGIKFPTVEHAFQAAKTLSHYERQMISEAGTPGSAKAMGRKVQLRSNWEEIKDDIMKICLKQKFKHSILCRLLLSTGNAELIEGNYWHDNHFGNCYCEKCKNIIGQNILGKLLMEIRDSY